jgi:hypothetical protein
VALWWKHTVQKHTDVDVFALMRQVSLLKNKCVPITDSSVFSKQVFTSTALLLLDAGNPAKCDCTALPNIAVIAP